MNGGLRIALPAGALFEDACRLLVAAGVAEIDPARLDRQLSLVTRLATVVKVRPTDVPVYVEMGACDAGIVGKDILWESPRDCYELVDLRFGACRLVLAAPEGSPLTRGSFPRSLRAATKYPVAARRYFHSVGLAVELIRLHGSWSWPGHGPRRLRRRHHRHRPDAHRELPRGGGRGWPFHRSSDLQPGLAQDPQRGVDQLAAALRRTVTDGEVSSASPPSAGRGRSAP